MKKVVWMQVEVEHGPFYNVDSVDGVVVRVNPSHKTPDACNINECRDFHDGIHVCIVTAKNAEDAIQQHHKRHQ